jgi:DNA-binding NtrC family response regulator
MGFDVTEANDGREAVRIFAADPAGFRLVLLDLTMPHLDGNETLAELRRIRDDVPVVVMSGFSQHEVASQFSGWEIAGCLQKPFSYETLDETLFRATEVELGAGARSN